MLAGMAVPWSTLPLHPGLALRSLPEVNVIGAPLTNALAIATGRRTARRSRTRA